MTRMMDLMPHRAFLPTREDGFDRWFEDWNLPAIFGEERSWVPAFDVTENEDNYVFHAELPGMEPKDIDVSLTDGLLTVKGEKKKASEDKNRNYHRIERAYGTFERTFRIPDNVETQNLEASYKDGVLKLVLPKGASAKPRKIEVK